MKYHDVKLVDGDIPAVTTSLAGGDEIVAQRIELRVSQFLGEWILDEATGLPWLEWLARKPAPVGEMSARLRAEIADTPGVERVERLDALDEGDEHLSFSGMVFTEAGNELSIAVDPFDVGDSNYHPAVQITGGSSRIG